MRIGNLMLCLCKVRNTQSFLSKCLLEENLDNDDRKLLLDVSDNLAKSSNMIRMRFVASRNTK